ncbi:hypothetical protein P691DRAFT_790709 [Macrolepiota fuliginosa MF-IS2]|uniref:Uncharacterized protein n=1 Tax=Macrolepiota fuliginosa MF-IS2 TaxID=1400762 RepID=A0A9P5X1Q6_9AGAR|nr:hypothetical protein P691DRAFT_790709 [Macrolepiota fuliginosa MF-IS2]
MLTSLELELGYMRSVVSVDRKAIHQVLGGSDVEECSKHVRPEGYRVRIVAAIGKNGDQVHSHSPTSPDRWNPWTRMPYILASALGNSVLPPEYLDMGVVVYRKDREETRTTATGNEFGPENREKLHGWRVGLLAGVRLGVGQWAEREKASFPDSAKQEEGSVVLIWSILLPEDLTPWEMCGLDGLDLPECLGSSSHTMTPPRTIICLPQLIIEPSTL